MAGPSPEVFIAFTIACLVLTLSPGPAVMYITALGLREGRGPAIAAAAGLGVGNFMHAIAAAVGLSALLLSSAIAFSAVKYIGAAYLIYLGIQTLRRRSDQAHPVETTKTTSRLEFRRGVVISTFNPKVAVFYLALFPSFVDPARGSVASQVLMLGAWLAVLGVATDALYGITAGQLGTWFGRRAGLRSTLQRFSGIVYILLGIYAALVSVDRTGPGEAANVK
ncbi:LysE family translocator [soil metagenome]